MKNLFVQPGKLQCEWGTLVVLDDVEEDESNVPVLGQKWIPLW